MFRWLYILPHLLLEANAARRDARIRFLNAQVEILRRKLGGNRVIPSPEDRALLLALGAELNHNVGDLSASSRLRPILGGSSNKG
jgi:hypothetical protein